MLEMLDVKVGGILDMLWIGFWIWLVVPQDLRYSWPVPRPREGGCHSVKCSCRMKSLVCKRLHNCLTISGQLVAIFIVGYN